MGCTLCWRFLLLLCAVTLSLRAEPLTLAKSIELAGSRYPALRAADASIRAANAHIALARTAYLPKVDAIAGFNRASRNNILGLMLPSQVIAPISGPVLNTNSLGSAWGSTVGLLVTWEPFDFGLRAASVALAAAGEKRAEAERQAQRMELSITVADAFLTLLAAQQMEAAAKAAIDRAGELARITDALTKAELRPGIDSTLARAEQAAATAQLVQSQQAVAEARASLAGLVGIESGAIDLLGDRLLQPPGALPNQSPLEANPMVEHRDKLLAESALRLDTINKTYVPRVIAQGTSYARGTGAGLNGSLGGGLSGLGPNIHNWAVGMTATWPLADLAAIRARRKGETATQEAERSRRDQLLLDLRIKRDRAIAAHEGAVRLAEIAPTAVEAARAALTQAMARYQAGLIPAIEVTETQRRLTQAEIDQRLASLAIWRARLAFYAAQGDVTPLATEADAQRMEGR